MQSFLIKRPVVTEKSLQLANTLNTYVFEVDPRATKLELKSAIATLYGVTVLSVNTIFEQRSIRRTGKKRTSSVQPKVKKAYVVLKAGDSIPVFDTYK